MIQAAGRLPGVYAIERDAAGERLFYYWRGEAPVRELMDRIDLAALASALDAAELVYLSGISLAVIGEAGRAKLIPLLASAAARGAPIALDVNYRAPLWPTPETAVAAVEAIAPHCRFLSLASEETAKLFGTQAALRVAEWSGAGAEVILRQEDRAVRVASKGQSQTFEPEPPVAVVDTTGAGDSFNAAYLATRLAGGAVEEAVRAGRRLAAAVVGRQGAVIPQDAMPQVGD